MSEKIRFSGKEIMKNVKLNLVIPENYIEVKNHKIIAETELAFLLNFIYNAKTIEKWLPKSRTINLENKFYIEDWLLK